MILGVFVLMWTIIFMIRIEGSLQTADTGTVIKAPCHHLPSCIGSCSASDAADVYQKCVELCVNACGAAGADDGSSEENVGSSIVDLSGVGDGDFDNFIGGSIQKPHVDSQVFKDDMAHHRLSSVFLAPQDVKTGLSKGGRLNFVHVPKAAGTTFTVALRDAMCSVVYNRDETSDCCRNPGFCDARADRKCSIVEGCKGGHMPRL
jgi:hypothetical protein